jgi:hypothetical protein
MVGTSFGLSAYDDNPRLPHCKERQNLGCNVEPWPINRLAIILPLHRLRQCNGLF